MVKTSKQFDQIIDKCSSLFEKKMIDYDDVSDRLDKIKIPSYRHDIENSNDIAEEIARILGYDNIRKKTINLHKDRFLNLDICNRRCALNHV